MTQTENYGFLLPTDDDFYDVEGQQNENWNIVDEELKKVSDKADAAEKGMQTRKVGLFAVDWSNEFPYTQTVAVDGITADSNVKVIGLFVADGSTEDQVKAIKKAAGFLMSNTSGTGNGTLTFKAYKKPKTDFTVVVEGG